MGDEMINSDCCKSKTAYNYLHFTKFIKQTNFDKHIQTNTSQTKQT